LFFTLLFTSIIQIFAVIVINGVITWTVVGYGVMIFFVAWMQELRLCFLQKMPDKEDGIGSV